MAHVIVVGETAMLKTVSLFLAQHDNTVSVIARTADEVQAIKDEATEFKERINPLTLDFNDLTRFRAQLEDAVAQYGPVTLAVNWLAPDTMDAADAVAEVLNATSPVARYFQILPVADTDPEQHERFFADPFGHLDRVLYRRIVLGFEVENGMSRWLNASEISKGVIHALRNDERDAVIGVLEHQQSA